MTNRPNDPIPFDFATASALSTAANDAFSRLESLDDHADESAFYALRDSHAPPGALQGV